MKRWIFTFLINLSILGASGQTVETITGQINASGGLSVDKYGNIYLADFGEKLSSANGTMVYKIAPDGTFLDTLANTLQGASGNVLDNQGSLYQSNIAGNKVSKITPSGVISTFVSNAVSNPVGLEFDQSGNLYVCNCGNNSIVKVAPDGSASTFSTNGLLNCPNGITRGLNDTMYVSNFGDGFVFKITPNGIATLHGIIPGGRNGHIEYSKGLLYVASHGSHQIHVMDIEGNVTLLAGTGFRGNIDGPIATAKLSVPNGVGISPTGDTLYFNCTVQTTTYPDIINPSLLRRITGLNVLTNNAKLKQLPIDVSIFPNPVVDNLVLKYQLQSPSNITLKLMGIDGKLYFSTALGMAHGIGEYNIDVSELYAGAYILVVEGDDFSVNRKVIIK